MKNKFVTVAGIQSAVSIDLKENLINTTQMIKSAIQDGAQIICLQELYKTPYFPQYKKVKKDDWVVVYTKAGIYTSSPNLKGNITHFFYWDKSSPIWTDPNDTVVLLHSDEWGFKYLGWKLVHKKPPWYINKVVFLYFLIVLECSSILGEQEDYHSILHLQYNS